jgi:hypothetical protein
MTQTDKRSRRRFLKVSSMFGLAVAFTPSRIANAFKNPKPNTTQEEATMTENSAAQGSAQATDKTAIRPFQFTFTDAELADLRRRVNATRWPERELVQDASQGVQLSTMQKLASYWGKDYDWRKGEAKLKAVPHFVTEIDGLDIHFIHVRSKEKNALPVIITHGWPGSIIEQLKIIEPLTNPTAHGGKAEDAFDVVIPSLPGYGFSAKPTAPGWNPVSIAGIARHSHQHGGYGSGRCFSCTRDGRPATGRPFAGGAARVGPAGRLLQEWVGLRSRDEQPPADIVRNRRFSDWPGGMDTRP